jgi:hypothetical protein
VIKGGFAVIRSDGRFGHARAVTAIDASVQLNRQLFDLADSLLAA